ncbi:NAD(P)/FAD-dependent oxidoreductase [Nevskia ramosa]|uniref:NAD(P)/FAD-dependent oxidoreductase n=1 Tax=Nevskia ramosa TaxID=64002 RepID=UPI002357C34A|nr:FAD-dependent oxidoreductase [Nevskia ramosa]
MSTTGTVLIVGAGQAGSELAAELRTQGHTGRVVMIGDEAGLPYKRPPLSKGFLTGAIPAEQLLIRNAAVYEKNNIEFIGGTSVTAIDRAAKTVTLSDGQTLGYDKLALTTGGRARPLPVMGADMANVMSLRSQTDAEKIREHLVAGHRLVIIGGGYIGLEIAAVAVKAGLEVTVLESAPRVLARVTAPEMSAFYTRVHREAGVEIQVGVQIAALENDGKKVSAVILADGNRVAADVVIVGIGLIPNTELATAAGLAVDNGIVVDEYGQTSDSDIVASGDCANRPSPLLGGRVRLESVPNAMDQARHAARLLVGQPKAYDELPWFWSDQYELKLQMCGLSSGYDQVVIRGSTETRAFSAFYLKDGRIIAADAVSQLKDFGVMKKLVGARATVAAERLADTTLLLKDLAVEAGL